jgi:hypothetical protein
MTKNRVFPDMSKLGQLKPKLTDGEMFLVQMLDQQLDLEWKIYVQPYLPNLRPDIVIAHPEKGLIVWEVKDWNLNNFGMIAGRLTGQADGRKWVQENPIYKTKLYMDAICEYVLAANYESISVGNQIPQTLCRGAVYFHKSNTDETFKLFKQTHQQYKSKICIFTREMIANNFEDNFRNNFPIYGNQYSGEVSITMDTIHQMLQPPEHEKERLLPLPNLTKEQQGLFDNKKRTTQLFKRIRGVAGSGKSIVLAHRASEQNCNGGNILILSYNSTMSHALRDLLKRSRLALNWNQIENTHFHKWLYNQAVFSGMLKKINRNSDTDENNFDQFITFLEEIIADPQKSPDYSETFHRGFYDGIYIDEAQDFEPKWLNLLAKYLKPTGEMVIFADHRQNIYKKDGGKTATQMKRCRFSGKWAQLKTSQRVTFNVATFLNKLAINTRIGDEEDFELEKQSRLNQKDFDFNVQTCIPVNTKFDAIMSINEAILQLGNPHHSDIAILTIDHATGLQLVKQYQEHFQKITHVFGETDWERKQRKFTFRMGTGCIKMCTIHSFKGWEISNVIVLWTKSPNEAQHSIRHELLYTAISRTLGNIVIINSNREDDKLFTDWVSKNDLSTIPETPLHQLKKVPTTPINNSSLHDNSFSIA